MKYSSIYFTFAVAAILYGNAWAQIQTEYNVFCDQHPASEVACFDRRTLIYCMSIGNNWYGTWIASCPDTLCCDSNLNGCTLNCSDELVTTVKPSSTSPSVTGTTPSTTLCNAGELKKHEGNCTHYFYCSQNTWVEAQCSIGVYDDYQKSCVFGICN